MTLALWFWLMAGWEPEFLSEEELDGYTSPPPDNNFEPVQGCTLGDVGWMKSIVLTGRRSIG